MPWVSSSNGQGAVRLNTTSSGVADFPGWYHLFKRTRRLCKFQRDAQPGRPVLGLPVADRCPGCVPTSSVIFQVFGDGQLLYQSPVVTSASGAVPLNVNVAGVQQLSLAVIASTGSTTGDSAVWVTPRLISTSNFSQRQVSPYTLTWTVSTNGQTLLTQTSDSFAFTYPGPGVYTVGLTVTDASGRYGLRQ